MTTRLMVAYKHTFTTPGVTCWTPQDIWMGLISYERSPAMPTIFYARACAGDIALPPPPQHRAVGLVGLVRTRSCTGRRARFAWTTAHPVLLPAAGSLPGELLGLLLHCSLRVWTCTMNAVFTMDGSSHAYHTRQMLAGCSYRYLPVGYTGFYTAYDTPAPTPPHLRMNVGLGLLVRGWLVHCVVPRVDGRTRRVPLARTFYGL